MAENNPTKLYNQAKNLPPKPKQNNLTEEDQLKLAILQARMSAILPLIFLISALIIVALSLVYPERSKTINAGSVITGLIGTAGALSKPNG